MVYKWLLADRIGTATSMDAIWMLGFARNIVCLG